MQRLLGALTQQISEATSLFLQRDAGRMKPDMLYRETESSDPSISSFLLDCMARIVPNHSAFGKGNGFACDSFKFKNARGSNFNYGHWHERPRMDSR